VTKKKLLFVLPSLAGGGAERAAVQILNALDSWDRSMYLFRREGPYLAEVSPAIHVAAGSSQGRIGRWRELRNYIRANRPDVVVSFLSYFSVLTAVRAAGVHAKVVFNQQTPMSAFLTDEDYPWRRSWHRRAFAVATRIGSRAADLIVTTSRGVADDLTEKFGIPSAHIRIVHNPFDLKAIAEAAREPLAPAHAAVWARPAIVAAGRLAEVKNFAMLIEAVALLRRSVPARLFILGQGDQEARLRQLIAARGLDESVYLFGFQPNPWKYFARADVLALTSRYEGFGNVLVEAMACGIPAVATASPGSREILENDSNGVLVDEHTPEAMAAALGTLLVDAARRARMAKSALDTSRRFGVETIAVKYHTLFAEMLA
jgi:glycosyltransferase involved in cell wall biosynthesis